MDGRGGCCIARYAATGAPHVSSVDRIMLRFRPIAPKPVAGSTASDGSSSESSDAFLKSENPKRKYVRVNNNSSKRRTRRTKSTTSPEQKNPVPAVTLALLPETPDPKESPARDLTPKVQRDISKNNSNKNAPVWLSFDKRTPARAEPYYYFCPTDPAAVRLGGWWSCAMVECVMDTWVEGEGLGSTDEERRGNLMKDTCPGFISDGYGRVTWTNKAYGEMMMGPEKREEGGDSW